VLKARHSPGQVEMPCLMREGMHERRVRAGLGLGFCEGVAGGGFILGG
jgi:hypothetical protein